MILTYYEQGLSAKASTLLLMISLNMCIQLFVVIGQYKKKSWKSKLKEVLITLIFLRPAVDAFRVSTNHLDEDTTIAIFDEMVSNKCAELATESIPGCVLQIYVWFKTPDAAGKYALTSIAVSALTTGFTSAMIAFDFDVDSFRRKCQPEFYGE